MRRSDLLSTNLAYLLIIHHFTNIYFSVDNITFSGQILPRMSEKICDSFRLKTQLMRLHIHMISLYNDVATNKPKKMLFDRRYERYDVGRCPKSMFRMT